MVYSFLFSYQINYEKIKIFSVNLVVIRWFEWYKKKKLKNIFYFSAVNDFSVHFCKFKNKMYITQWRQKIGFTD